VAILGEQNHSSVQDAGIQSENRFRDRNRGVISRVCIFTFLENGRDRSQTGRGGGAWPSINAAEFRMLRSTAARRWGGEGASGVGIAWRSDKVRQATQKWLKNGH
jgi:hypothetical protein